MGQTLLILLITVNYGFLATANQNMSAVTQVQDTCNQLKSIIGFAAIKTLAHILFFTLSLVSLLKTLTIMNSNPIMSLEGVVQKMRATDRRFQKACRQLVILNNRLEDLNTQYRRSRRNNKPGSRYNLRLKLSVVEGIRNMFYEYASSRADELENMQDCLIEAGLIQPPVTD